MSQPCPNSEILPPGVGPRQPRLGGHIYHGAAGPAPDWRRCAAPDGAPIVMQLHYRPPYDWEGVMDFFRHHAVEGVETVTGGLGLERTWARLSDGAGKLPDQAEHWRPWRSYAVNLLWRSHAE